MRGFRAPPPKIRGCEKVEKRFCIRCGAELEQKRLRDLPQEMLVCLKCNTITRGFVEDERELVKDLLDHGFAPFEIEMILEAVRKHYSRSSKGGEMR